MNNNNGDYPVINSMRLKAMLLEDWRPPDLDVLVAELEERKRAKKSREQHELVSVITGAEKKPNRC